MPSTMDELNTFDQHASAYSATVEAALGASGERHDYFIRLKAALTRRALPDLSPSRILDFGCGIGLSTMALADAYPQAIVTGVDDSSESIAVAREADLPEAAVEFTPYSGASLPFEDDSFDLAFAACVFHHIAPEHRRHWTQELSRVVRGGGALIMFEHNPYNPLTRHVVASVPFDEGVALLRASEVRRLVAAAGMQPSSPHYYFYFPRWLAGLRPLERWLRRVPLGAQYFVVGRAL